METDCPATTNPYLPRLHRVLAHMRSQYGADLDLDALAGVAALSRFHFHRVFTAMLGQTPAEALRSIRMARAAELLVATRVPLAQIATEVGYPAMGSFTRTFRHCYRIRPAAMRKRGQFPPAPLPPKIGVIPMYQIQIKTLPDLRAAGLDHIGPYSRIGETFGKLAGILDKSGLWRIVNRAAVGIYYDAPDAKPADQLRAHAGLLVAADATLPPGLVDLRIAGGRYGVLRLVGPYSGLPAAWAWAYGHWLPQSGQELADAPPFELNLNSPMDTAPEDLITEICIKLV